MNSLSWSYARSQGATSQESAKLLKASLAFDSRDPENTDRVKSKMYMQKVVPLVSSEIVKAFARASWLGRGGDGVGAGAGAGAASASAALVPMATAAHLLLQEHQCAQMKAPAWNTGEKNTQGETKHQIYSR